MAGINNIKLKTLKQTRAFYIWELKKKSLTEKERASYLLALKSINKIIKEKEQSGKVKKHKKFISSFFKLAMKAKKDKEINSDNSKKQFARRLKNKIWDRRARLE